jgi:solute carrier family 25 phosphate transporter 23/24/25/41
MSSPVPVQSHAEFIKEQSLHTVKSLTAGAIAGAVSRTLTSPLERLKVMKQVQSSGDAYHGIVSALRKMYREEGLKAYWKGNGTNVARIAPFSAIQFFSFDVYKKLLLPDDGSTEPSFLRTFSAGALTGITASTICYPLDLVRSVLSVQTSATSEYNGILDTLKKIARKDGFIGLYRGLTPTLMGIAPYVAINMTTFDLLRRKYLPNRDHPYFSLINLSLGACAGFTAAGITYPTDLIRRRMQLQGTSGVDLPKYNGTMDCIKTMIRTEGVRSLYKGLIPCFMKVVPSMAVSFMLYEFLRKTWKFQPPSAKPPAVG